MRIAPYVLAAIFFVAVVVAKYEGGVGLVHQIVQHGFDFPTLIGVVVALVVLIFGMRRIKTKRLKKSQRSPDKRSASEVE